MANAALDLLLDIVDQAFDHRSWHGPNLRGSLRGVTFDQAAWRPDPDRHTIWEQVLHAAYWKYVVRRRILGEKRGSFPRKGSNWPEPEETTAAGWRRDVQLLVDTHASLRAAIAGMRPAKLHQPLGRGKDTLFLLISGAAAHDVYHAGQIQLIKRMQA